MNLLYDHSLTPRRDRQEETDRSERSGYPGTDKIIGELGAVRVAGTGTAEIYKLNGLYFQLRYSGVAESSFGGVSRRFSENIDVNAPRLIVAIRKKPDADMYSVAGVDPSKAKDSGSWGTSGASWSPPLTRDKADEEILKLIKEAAGV